MFDEESNRGDYQREKPLLSNTSEQNASRLKENELSVRQQQSLTTVGEELNIENGGDVRRRLKGKCGVSRRFLFSAHIQDDSLTNAK